MKPRTLGAWVTIAIAALLCTLRGSAQAALTLQRAAEGDRRTAADASARR